MDALAILTPIISSAATGFAVWYFQSRIERLNKAQEQLREDRKRVYLKLLEPFVRVLVSSKVPDEGTKAVEQIKSFEYKMLVQEMYYFANDKVVNAFNDMMQAFYNTTDAKPIDPIQFLKLWGNLTLQIRHAIGTNKSGLREADMLKGWITDINKYTDQLK